MCITDDTWSFMLRVTLLSILHSISINLKRTAGPWFSGRAHSVQVESPASVLGSISR